MMTAARDQARPRSIATPSSFTPGIGASLATRTLTQGAREVVEQEIGDRLRERLQQLVRVIVRQTLQAPHDRRVIERVGEVARPENLVRGQAELDVEAQRLRQVLFPLVDADARLDAQVVNEDRVHAGLLRSRPCAF